MRPSDAMHPTKAAVLWAVVMGASTVGQVADLLDHSKNTVHRYLRQLHDEGLVLYPPGVTGALRPRLEVVRIL